MHGLAAFHMQYSGQHAINTEASGKFAVADINKRLVCKSYTDLDIVKIEEQATLDGKFRIFIMPKHFC